MTTTALILAVAFSSCVRASSVAAASASRQDVMTRCHQIPWIPDAGLLVVVEERSSLKEMAAKAEGQCYACTSLLGTCLRWVKKGVVQPGLCVD